MRIPLRSWILLAAITALIACTSQIAEGPGIKAADVRHKAPAFKLQGADGSPVALENYHGKVVLLNFWATWCGPCKIETPWFVDFQRTYKDRGFTVLGISMDDDGWDSVRPWTERRKINYPNAIATEQLRVLY